MGNRAAIYLRISNDDQALGLAVERQRQDCRRIVETQGWELVDEYVDNGISASKRLVSRPAYDRLVADYASGRYDALVCWDLDRLTRQPRQLEDWIDAAEERGLVIMTANGEADLSTDNGRLFARIKASVARSEIERKGARQRRANVQRSEQGRPTPGRRRYGYETDGITPVPHEAEVVRRVFKHIHEGGSVRSIFRALETEGISPKPGKEWSMRRIRDICMNPHYSGFVRHLGATVKSEHVTPIVDEELAAEVRAILADPTRRTTPGPKVRHLLSGVLVCNDCGADMFYMRAYMCSKVNSHANIKKDIIEPYVLDEVAKAFITGGPDLFPTVGDAGTITELMSAHAKNAAAVAQIVEDRDEGLVPASVARSRLIELRSAREEIEAALERARTAKSSSSALLDVAHGLLTDSEYTMGDFAQMKATVLSRFAELDIDRQREIVRALLHIEVKKGRDVRKRVHIEHKLATHLNVDDPLTAADV